MAYIGILAMFLVISLVIVSLHQCRTYDLKCPETQHFKHRAAKCQNLQHYICLINTLKHVYEEACIGPDINPPGTKVVFQPNLHKANCSQNRYQPIIFDTWMNSDCIFQKSQCTEEGQVVYSNGSTVRDVWCTCDYTRGYTFVTPPVNKCYCVPSEEDCSCYIPGCKVSQDHYCEDRTTRPPNSLPLCKRISKHQNDVKFDISTLQEVEDITPTKSANRLYTGIAVGGTCMLIMGALICISFFRFELEPVTVTISKKSARIFTGNSLVLNCTVNGDTTPSAVLWTRSVGGPEETIQLTPDKHSGGTVDDPSLTVHTVTAEDSGTYVCKLMFENDEVSSNSLTIHVENLTSGDTKPLSHYDAVTTIGKSVGCIIGPKKQGTCWRVGKDKIITAFHVVADNIWNPTADGGGTLLEPLIADMKVYFNYMYVDEESHERQCFKLRKSLYYHDKTFDVAVLQLETNTSLTLPPPIELFDEVTPEKHSDQEIILIGHNKGKPLEVNRGIRLYNPTEQKMKELQEFCEKKIGEGNGYVGLDNKSRLVIKCEFEGGASGCPGFTILNDRGPRVVLIYLQGYPSFYYSPKFSKKKNDFPQDKLLQQGVGIYSLYRDMTQNKCYLGLRNEIFPLEAKRERQSKSYAQQNQYAMAGDNLPKSHSDQNEQENLNITNKDQSQDQDIRVSKTSEQAKNTLDAWRQSDKVFCPNNRAYKAAVDTVESGKITAIIGGPGIGKSATARHIALEYETKEWQVIPVTSLDEVVDYADPTEKQVFVIDDLFGVYSAEMSVYNMLKKWQDNFLNGQGEHFKLLIPSRKSVYNEVMGQCSYISVVDLDNEKLLYDENEKKKILVNHCKSANLSENVYNNLSLSTQFMFPFLCSQFVCNENYQKCGERFFTNPHECIIEELDRLKKHNDVQYAALVLCLLNNNELKDVKHLSEKLKREVYDRCCKSTGTTSQAIINALKHLTGVYVTQIGNQFSFIHDSIQEIVGYHFGRDNKDLILKYMSCSFIWSKITVSKAMKNGDLCIEVGEEYYQMLAVRMYRDIKDKDTNQLFDVFKNKSVSYAPFVKTFMDIVKGMKRDELEELFDVCQVPIRQIEIKEESKSNYTYIIMNKTWDVGIGPCYNIRIITWIIYNGHAKMLTTLLKYVKRNKQLLKKIFTNQNEQQRLLILACLSENINTVNVLLQWIDTSNINSTYNSTFNQYTPLTAACTTGNVDMIKYLVSCGADINLPDGNDSYHISRADIYLRDGYPRYPLSVACEHGHLEAVKYFVEHGVNVNKDNCEYPPLHAASSEGHIGVIRYLLDKGANIDLLDESSRSPLHCAASKAQTAAVSLLLDKGANIDLPGKDKRTPLFIAAQENHIDIVALLLEQNAYIDSPDEYNMTPLFIAALHDHIDIVALLLDRGANIDLPHKNKQTPLFIAASHNNIDILTLLLKQNAKIDLPDKDNKTPLYMATKKGHGDIVRLLIEHKCCVNVTNNRGESPLYIAARDNNTEILQILISAGADLNLKTEEGVTPLMIALVSKNQEIVQTLVKAENNKEQNTYQRVKDKPDKLIKPRNLHLFETIVDLRGSAMYIDDDGDYYNSTFFFKHADKYRLRCGDAYLDSTEFAMFNDFDFVNVQTVCKNLIKFGWEVNKHNNKGESPLLLCCKYLLKKRAHQCEKISDVIIMLIENVADPYYKNNNNEDVHDRVERWREIDRWKHEHDKQNFDLFYYSLGYNFRDTPRICKIRSVMDFLEVVSLVTKKVVMQQDLDKLNPAIEAIKIRIRRNSI